MLEKIAKEWFDAYNRRDFMAIDGIYAENALIHGKDGDFRGGKAVVDMAKKWLEAIPDAKISTPWEPKMEGDVAVFPWRVEGTLSGSIREIQATGERVVFHGMTFFRCDLKCKKVVEHWALVDYRSLKQQVMPGS